MGKIADRLKNGIITENPTFVQMLGMCPTLAVTSSAINGLGMGLTTMVILTMSNFMISLLRKLIPDKVRIPAYIVIIASFVTIVQFVLQAYIPSLNDSLGIFIPLIVVNCIILGRAESYASKNPDKPIEDVFLTGDGALIRGIDGLFKVQLNVSTRIMDTLYNIKFDPSIDLKVYNPVYLVTPIGAAFAPMGFELADVAASATKAEGSLAPFIALIAVAAIGAAGMAFYSINKKNTVTEKRDQLESDIARISDIEDIIDAYDAAEAKYTDMESMYYTTYQLNENARQFISELESKIPTSVVVSSFSSDNNGVSMPCVSTSYDAIADFIMQLKTIDCVDNAYVASISKKDTDGEITYEFTVTVNYVPMMENPEASTDDAGDTETTEAEAE